MYSMQQGATPIVDKPRFFKRLHAERVSQPRVWMWFCWGPAPGIACGNVQGYCYGWGSSVSDALQAYESLKRDARLGRL